MVSDHDRCFVGIWMPVHAQDTLVSIQNHLGLSQEVKWEAAKNLHLTLMFLGATAREIQPNLVQQLAAVATAHSPLHLTLGKLGAFYRQGHLNVIWVSLEGQIDALKELHKSVASVAKKFGFRPDSFKPHVTIGRARALPIDRSASVERAVTAAENPGQCDIAVSSFSLMQSRAGYHSVADFALRS